jgi:hypothetical protein
LIESKTIPFLHSTFEASEKVPWIGWGGWENLDGWMKWMGIDCTTTSPISFEKRIWIVDGWMDGLGIKNCLLITCCAWVCLSNTWIWNGGVRSWWMIPVGVAWSGALPCVSW